MKKKKEKSKTAAEMPEFSFKEFNEEESRIYDEAISAYRKAIEAGKHLKDTYEAYPISDDELRSIIQADFLKILIAERHFSKREPLDAIASSLGVPLDLLQKTMQRMLQEVGITAANQFGQEMLAMNPDMAKTDD